MFKADKPKAVIYDLDNTIFDVSCLQDGRLEPMLLNLLEALQIQEENAEVFRSDFFQKSLTALEEDWHFSNAQRQILRNVLSKYPIIGILKPDPKFPDSFINDSLRFLVTTGDEFFQTSKISALDIESYFDRIIIVDNFRRPEFSKLAAFKDLCSEYGLKPDEVWVLGDSIESELKAGRQLGMQTILFCKSEMSQSQPELLSQIVAHSISSLADLPALLHRNLNTRL